MAQSCIPLAGSTACPAFTSSSVSTDETLRGLFPFLANVTDRQSFDSGLRTFVNQGYVQQKYINLFGCSNINLSNTTDLYARYTTSFLCNAIIQNSAKTCGLSAADSRPLCADTCAEFALSEQRIVSSPDLCASPSANEINQLRADFTDCALPSDSITGNCVPGYANEPNNCGFQINLDGLCAYCNGSTINSTDSCCQESRVDSRCQNVHLPTPTSMQPLFTTTTTSTSTSTSTAISGSGSSSSNGLSGGQIAGIVIGSIAGAAILLTLLVCCFIMNRRRQRRASRGSLNQPSPPRTSAAMTQRGPQQFEALPGARVTRMAALEGSSGATPYNGPSGRTSGGLGTRSEQKPPPTGFESTPESAAATTPGAAVVSRRKKSSPEQFSSSPETGTGDYSSPDNGGTTQSERLSSFKDYYSSDEIRSGDLVSTLWAYQPRANDEFELERGQMLKVVGIWDDGWATGVRITQRAEDWEPPRSGRDSVVSDSDVESTPSGNGEVKAFPLVCVCLPQHWRRTIEGDSADPSSPEGHSSV